MTVATSISLRKAIVGLGLSVLAAVPSAHSLPIRALKVTNLADVGPGSLRDCVNQTFPRVCIFEVTGRIVLSDALRVRTASLYVAGQTAPAPGVILTNAGVSVEAPDVTVQHIGVLAGDGPSAQKPSDRDSLKVLAPAKRVTLDHLSLLWGVDEGFSSNGAVEDVTLSNSIVAEGLMNGIHPEGPHSMGALVGVGGRRVIFKNNLFASNRDRNVRWREDTSGRMIGNVISGWGGTSNWNTTNPTNPASGPPIFLDMIGNVFLKTAASTLATPAFGLFAQGLQVPSGSKFFLRGNLSPSRNTQALPDWNFTNLPLETYRSLTPLVGDDVPEVGNTVNVVLDTAGARPWARGAVESRIVSEARTGTGQIVDCVVNCRANTVRVPGAGYPLIAEVHRPLNAPAQFADQQALDAWLSEFSQGEVVMVPTATPTTGATPTEMPVLTATAAVTATATATRTANPTRTPTPTPTATAGSSCDATVAQCRSDCEECERFFLNRVGAYPYNPAATCEQKLATCRLLCESGCN